MPRRLCPGSTQAAESRPAEIPPAGGPPGALNCVLPFFGRVAAARFAALGALWQARCAAPWQGRRRVFAVLHLLHSMAVQMVIICVSFFLPGATVPRQCGDTQTRPGVGLQVALKVRRNYDHK